MNTPLHIVPYVGIDITDIARFRGLSRRTNKKLLNKIFTPNELTYCFSVDDSASRLAVRFAAKEAVRKALSPAGIPPVNFYDIEVLRKKNGIPEIVLRVPKLKHVAIKISLSHAKESAVAVALVFVSSKT